MESHEERESWNNDGGTGEEELGLEDEMGRSDRLDLHADWP